MRLHFVEITWWRECRPSGTFLFPAFVSRHCRAGFSYAAALRLEFLVPAGFLDGRSWKLDVRKLEVSGPTKATAAPGRRRRIGQWLRRA